MPLDMAKQTPHCIALTWPVSVSNLYSLIAGLFEPTVVFIGVIDGAIIIHETGLPAIICIHTTNKLALLSLQATDFPTPLLYTWRNHVECVSQQQKKRRETIMENSAGSAHSSVVQNKSKFK